MFSINFFIASSYLKNQAIKFQMCVYVCIILIPIAGIIVGRHLITTSNTFNFFVGTGLGSLTCLLLFLRDKSITKKTAYLKGKKGEEYLENILKQLPAGFKYFKPTQTYYGNIDFLVVSRNGIFCIEEKNINGKITYRYTDKQLLRNYTPFNKDYLKQTKRNAFMVNQMIKEAVKMDIYVMPILVFSGLGVTIDIKGKADGVDVIDSWQLLDFLKQQKDAPLLNDKILTDIENIFI